MSIYKPSNFSPSFEEIDPEYTASTGTESTQFSCQVNTNGDPIKAYKMQILATNTNECIYTEGAPTTLETSQYVKNKAFLSYSRLNRNLKMQAKKDYQWGIRVYDHIPRGTYTEGASGWEQPKTLVCEGFTVGSTKSVIWSNLSTTYNKTATDQILVDRYIEFETSEEDSDDIVIGNKELSELQLPTFPYRERQKINYVTNDLGTDEDILKIETVDPFKYNYRDGTQYKIFMCSDEHTTVSTFGDPNSNINVSDWLIVYNDAEDAASAKAAGDDPSKTEYNTYRSECMYPVGQYGGTKSSRKIVGYSSDTGEIRIYDAFYRPAKNGECYRIFRQNSSGSTVTYTAIDDDNLSGHLVGGTPITDSNFKTLTSAYIGENSSSYGKIFIQPNTNIKIDSTNPDQFVFSDGRRYIAEIQSKVNQNYNSEYNLFGISKFVSTENTLGSSGTLTLTISGGSSSNYSRSWSFAITDTISEIVYTGSTSLGTYTSVSLTYSGTSTFTIISKSGLSINLDHPIYFYFKANQHNNTVSDMFLGDLNSIFGDTDLNLTSNVIQGKLVDKNIFIDTTINKLDNSQWLLCGPNLKYIGTSTDPGKTQIIRPQTDYSVYTDFIDSSPYQVVYARTPINVSDHIYYANYLIPGTISHLESSTPITAKDITFYYNSDGSYYSSDNSTPLKYFQYFLYSVTVNVDGSHVIGDLIKQSDEIYDASLSWTYRGLESLQWYKVELLLVDEYSKQFIAEQEFYVNYESLIQSDTGFVTCSLDCHENAIKIDCLIPETAISTDFPVAEEMKTLQTVSQSSSGNYGIAIDVGNTLNYDQYSKSSDQFPIKLPYNFTFLTKFKLANNFVTSIPAGSTKTVMAIGVDKTSNTNEIIRIKASSPYKYYLNDQNKIAVNSNISRIQVFVDDSSTALTCFQDDDGNWVDYYDILANLPSLVSYEAMKYCLQSTSNYKAVSTIPSSIDPNTYYIFTQQINNYPPGVYKYVNGVWKIQEDYTYIYAESASSFASGSIPDGFVLDALKDTSGNIQYSGDSDSYLWIDTQRSLDIINASIYNNTYFTLFLRHNEEDTSHPYRCIITIE